MASPKNKREARPIESKGLAKVYCEHMVAPGSSPSLIRRVLDQKRRVVNLKRGVIRKKTSENPYSFVKMDCSIREKSIETLSKVWKHVLERKEYAAGDARLWAM
jgi:hypothetical protein